MLRKRIPTRSRSHWFWICRAKKSSIIFMTKYQPFWSENNIAYVKWDMNRSPRMYTQSYCRLSCRERSCTDMLGIYDLMDRITTNFPDILLEGRLRRRSPLCEAFYYSPPQIWCSDDTDPIERPNTSRTAHPSAIRSAQSGHMCPLLRNHQTGRNYATPYPCSQCCDVRDLRV